MWMLELPLAWALAHPLGFGPTGVFVAVSVAFSTLAFVSGYLFSKGTWKTKRVIGCLGRLGCLGGLCHRYYQPTRPTQATYPTEPT
jgi:hypothetical protein